MALESMTLTPLPPDVQNLHMYPVIEGGDPSPADVPHLLKSSFYSVNLQVCNSAGFVWGLPRSPSVRVTFTLLPADVELLRMYPVM